MEEGEIRSIGLSNWYVEELTEFLPQVDTVPAVVQNEIHPYFQENDVIPFIQDLGIVVHSAVSIERISDFPHNLYGIRSVDNNFINQRL